MDIGDLYIVDEPPPWNHDEFMDAFMIIGSVYFEIQFAVPLVLCEGISREGLLLQKKIDAAYIRAFCSRIENPTLLEKIIYGVEVGD